ncbi:peroxiredoxin-like 2C isoform X1 [Pogona vitticeps]
MAGRATGTPAERAVAAAAPVTRQIGDQSPWRPPGEEPAELRDAARCLVVDAAGKALPFGSLYKERKAIVVFVRHFLCYVCKEYVEDLGKIPKKYLQDANVKLIVIGQSSHHHIKPFCNLTGYPHEMYVDPEREIYKTLGMKSGETSVTSVHSPHVKSNWLSGSVKSIWRAMASPAFDFQGDPAQQGGTLILGPGNEIHFVHLDKNRLDHMPINTILQLAGVQTVDFTQRSKIINV